MLFFFPFFSSAGGNDSVRRAQAADAFLPGVKAWETT